MKTIADPNPSPFNPYGANIKYLDEALYHWSIYDFQSDDDKQAILWFWGSWHRRGLLMLGANPLASEQEKQIIGVLYGIVSSVLSDMVAVKAGLEISRTSEQLINILQEQISILHSFTVEFPQLKY